MKGLALDVVWGLVIAIVGVLVFLSLITGALRSAATWFYCDIYLKISNFFARQETASVPEICKYSVKNHVKIEEIFEGGNKNFSRRMLAYAIACWNDAEMAGLYETHPCYELHLMKNVDDVTEKNVSDILVKEDHCMSIENSDYGCGAKNQIIWSVDGGIINDQKIIVVEYNGKENAIEVIG